MGEGIHCTWVNQAQLDNDTVSEAFLDFALSIIEMEHIPFGQSSSSSTENSAISAGKWLVSVCAQRDSVHQAPPPLTPLEQYKFDEFLTHYYASPIFRQYYVEAVRVCLSKKVHPDYQLVRDMLEKDTNGSLFANETDILQVAINAVKIQPGHLGQSPKVSCPELLQICKELINHGALVDCFDNKGNSPLFYACVLGYAELFRFLVENGARTSTLHRRSPPDQFSEKEKKPIPASNSEENAALGGKMKDDNVSDQAEEEGQVQVNLLQITSDAILSAERVIDMTWWSFPPGLMMDMPLWKLEFTNTWPQIILYLLQEGLQYARDDPGLVYILHIACAQGAVDVVAKLLEFGVAIGTAGPSLKNMGAGCGRSFGTALHAAASRYQHTVAKLLIQTGANPRACCPCELLHSHKSPDLTPVQVAMASHPEDVEQLRAFLEYLVDIPGGLADADYISMIKFCAELGQVGFVKRLLERDFTAPMIARVGNKEMAELLISYNVALDAAAIQRTALERQRIDLLRWCVDKYGPLLPSDPESWGKMINRWMNSGRLYMNGMRYLVLEYPGPHIDAVLSALLRLPGEKHAMAAPTSWLHMAALYDNIPALDLLLDNGADPSCPGLPVDAATMMRTSNYNHRRSINERLKIVHKIERPGMEVTQDHVPSYRELKSRNAKRIESQKRAWNKRVAGLVGSHREIPFFFATQTKMTKTAATVPYIKVPPDLLPLDDSKSAFRLLELLPSKSGADPLVGRVLSTDLTLQPVFEALSYVWGQQTDSESISLDGQVVSITPNLHAALIKLRQKDQVRTLWIDALCMQQSHHAERNQQVAIMGHIYRAAKQVIVWLGEEADDSDLVFTHINEKSHERKFIDRPEPSPRQRCAWESLVNRSWFYRTWVIQEVALSRKAIVMCGKDSAPWMDIESGNRRDISGGGGGLSTVHSSPGPNPDHPLSGFDADRHVWRLRLLKLGSDAVEILRYSRLCQTSEPRDRVYGILGLFEPGFMTVDYDLPVGRIFRDFTEAVIRMTGNLSVLNALGCRHLELSEPVPSWVPNLTVVEAGGVLPHHKWHAPYRRGGSPKCYNYRKTDGTEGSIGADCFPSTILPGLAFQGDGAIVLNGKIADTIRVLGPELRAGEDSAPGTTAYMEIMETWENLATELISNWDKKLGPSVTNAFATTLAASQESTLHSTEAGFVEWYRYCGTGVLQENDPSLFIRNLEYYFWWLNVGKDDEKDEDYKDGQGFDLSRYADEVDMACYGRRFFITEGGSMGLAGPDACAGDRVAFIPGGDRPFVLRQRKNGHGWTMEKDCYLYGLNPYELFEEESILVDEFVIY